MNTHNLAATILVVGFVVFFVGVAIFTTEAVGQMVASTALITVGLAAMNWITSRYDFSKNEN